MLDNNNKELDKLFRSKLQNNEVAENKWNVPPMDIFENALSEIEVVETPEKKRRWPVLFFIGFGLAMLGGTSYLFYRNQSMMIELDKKIEVLNNAQNNSAKEIYSNTPTKTNSNNANLESTAKTATAATDSSSSKRSVPTQNELVAKIELNNQTNSIQKSPTSKNKVINVAASNSVQTNIVDTRNTATTPVSNNSGISQSSVITNPAYPVANNKNINKNNNKAVFNTDLQKPATIASRSTVEMKNIPTLKFRLPVRFESELPIVFDDTNQGAKYSDNSDNKEVSRFSPYLLLGIQGLNFNTTWEPTMSGGVVDNNGYGGQLGVGTAYKLSEKWSLESSLSIKNMVSNSVYKHEMVYDESREVLNSNGDMVYRMDLSGVTPSHLTVQQLEFRVDANEMQDGDIMYNDTKTKSTFNLVTLNVGARYRAAQIGKFDLFLTGGFGGNMTSSVNDKMDVEISSQSEMMMNESAMEYKTALEPFFLSGYVGTQLNYRLNKRYTIGLNTNYEKGFNSIFVNPMLNSTSSKLNTVNATIRLGYRF